MLRFASVMTGVLLVTAGTWLSPQEAAACSCFPTRFSDGEPADGATDVPIDVQPWVRAPAADPSEVVLEDSAGNVVDAEVRVSAGGSGGYDCVFGFAEIVPRRPLTSGERYTIRLVNELAEQISPWSFTTGETLLEPATLAAPEARLALVDAPEHMDTCVYRSLRACIGAPGEGTLEVSALRSGVLTERFFIGATKDCDLMNGLLALDSDASSETPPDAMEDVDTPAMSDGGAQAADTESSSDKPPDAMDDGGARVAAHSPNGDGGSCSIRASSQAASSWCVGMGALALWLFIRRRQRR